MHKYEFSDVHGKFQHQFTLWDDPHVFFIKIISVDVTCQKAWMNYQNLHWSKPYVQRQLQGDININEKNNFCVKYWYLFLS